jgi:hypothetical protein
LSDFEEFGPTFPIFFFNNEKNENLDTNDDKGANLLIKWKYLTKIVEIVEGVKFACDNTIIY